MKRLQNEKICYLERCDWLIQLDSSGRIPECVEILNEFYLRNFYWLDENKKWHKVYIDLDTMICEVNLDV